MPSHRHSDTDGRCTGSRSSLCACAGGFPLRLRILRGVKGSCGQGNKGRHQALLKVSGFGPVICEGRCEANSVIGRNRETNNTFYPAVWGLHMPLHATNLCLRLCLPLFTRPGVRWRGERAALCDDMGAYENQGPLILIQVVRSPNIGNSHMIAWLFWRTGSIRLRHPTEEVQGVV